MHAATWVKGVEKNIGCSSVYMRIQREIFSIIDFMQDLVSSAIHPCSIEKTNKQTKKQKANKQKRGKTPLYYSLFSHFFSRPYFRTTEMPITKFLVRWNTLSHNENTAVSTLWLASVAAILPQTTQLMVADRPLSSH